MDNEFINLTSDNIEIEHLCCIIRNRKPHSGIEAKRSWLVERLNEGHVFRKLNEKEIVFIEYAPVEKAWVPIIGDNFYYIYCLWVLGNHAGKGYGRKLMEYCIQDAKDNGKSGICMLGSKKQKHWLTDQTFAKKFGFEIVDSAANDYELFALSFDGMTPKFTDKAKLGEIDNKELTIYYDLQCPYMLQNIETISKYCENKGILVSMINIDSLDKAKDLPCPFNNFAVFYGGKFQTVNLLLDTTVLDRIIKNNNNF